MMRERVLSYPLAGPELRVDEGAEESDSALFLAPCQYGDAILIIDLGHRRKTKVGVKDCRCACAPR